MTYWLIGRHRGRNLLFGLDEGVWSVGRTAGNDISLPSSTASRRHAIVSVENDVVLVSDLGSMNGTSVNGDPLEGSCVLRVGDEIEFGSVRLRLTDQATAPTATWMSKERVTESVHLSHDDSSDGAAAVAAQDARLFSLILEAGQLMVDPGDRQETFERAVALVDRAIPAERVLILERSDVGALVQRAARVRHATTSELVLSGEMTQRVLEEGAAFVTTNAQGSDLFDGESAIRTQGVHSAMAAPLVHGDRTLGLLYVDSSDPSVQYVERNLRALVLLGQMLGVKIATARMIEVERESELLHERLETAATIQRRMLPQSLPAIAGHEVYTMQEMCEEVGGDLYDVGPTSRGRWQVVLGDVSGKGMGAALVMTDALGVIRVLRDMEKAPDEIVTHLDRHLTATTATERYLTLFLAELDPISRRLEYVNAGHPPPYLVHPDGAVIPLVETGVPVGWNLPVPEPKFRSATAELPPGTKLVVYSDGILEAEGTQEEFGEERLLAAAQQCAQLTAVQTAKHVLAAVEAFVGDEPQSDDLTLLVLAAVD